MQSFSFGRPPFMTLNYVDCAMAEDPTEVTHEDGSKEMGCKFLRIVVLISAQLTWVHRHHLDLAVHPTNHASTHRDCVQRKTSAIRHNSRVGSQSTRLSCATASSACLRQEGRSCVGSTALECPHLQRMECVSQETSIPGLGLIEVLYSVA